MPLMCIIHTIVAVAPAVAAALLIAEHAEWLMLP
jgi:hypothetical protein